MHNNLENQPGVPRPPTNSQMNPFGNPFYGAGSYRERILGSSSDYVQSTGHWTRITELVGGRLSYKPPIYDINDPDLYIPLMVFSTYIVLAGFSLGLHGK
ncbi:unnamed protein product [Ilex paraguariensis]